MKELNWLQKTTGRMLLKKELAKNGLPKALITAGLIEELFERIEHTCLGLSMISSESMTTNMVTHIESAAGHIGLLLSGSGMGPALDGDMVDILRKHGIKVG